MPGAIRPPSLDDNLSPYGLVLVSRGASAEQLQFMYPFVTEEQRKNDANKQPSYNAKKAQKKRKSSSQQHGICDYNDYFDFMGDAEYPGIAEPIMAHLFAVRPESCNEPFEIKIDCVRYAGYPFLVTRQNSPTGCKKVLTGEVDVCATGHETKKLLQRQLSKEPTSIRPHMFNIVFILHASASRSVVACYQSLSKRLAIAIDHEESRCGYLSKQIHVMREAHDDIQALPEGQEVSPYDLILKNSRLATMLKTVFEDVRETGNVSIFVNDWIEVAFCLPQKALLVAGTPSTSYEQLEHALCFLRPYHGLLLLDEMPMTIDGSPTLGQLLRYHTPSKSLQDLAADSDLPMSQVFLITRHLLLWCKATVIYPLCETNLYAIAPDAVLSNKNVESFSDAFPGNKLAAVLAEFSPPAALVDFTNPMSYSPEERAVRSRIVVWLLRKRLLVQLHTHIYVVPPFSDRSSISTPSEHRCQRIEKIILEHKNTFDPAVLRSISDICELRRQSCTADQRETDLNTFFKLSRYLNGEHHIEEMMFEENCTRATLLRIFDVFSSVLVTTTRQDTCVYAMKE